MIDLTPEEHMEECATGWFDKLGWSVLTGAQTIAEREDQCDVLLRNHLRAAVERLNPELPHGAGDLVIGELLKAEFQRLEDENFRLHEALTSGVNITYTDSATGEPVARRARLVNYIDPAVNDFTLVRQLTVAESRDTGRTFQPSLVAYVNGIPVAVIELRRPSLKSGEITAWQRIQIYTERVPRLMKFVELCVTADSADAAMGTQFGDAVHWAPWKAITGKDKEGATPAPSALEVLIKGVFDHERLCSLLENFIVFSKGTNGLVKRIAKYHQFHAVRAAADEVRNAVADGTGKGGIVRHTQGSGKSLEILFCAALFRKDPVLSNPTVVVVTDRSDLDDQLFREVFSTSIKLLPEPPRQIATREELRTVLAAETGGTFFTTMQKFGIDGESRAAGRAHPLLSNRSNVIVIVDEAHRTQYALKTGFARHLRDALPNATFLAFTGTPRFEGEHDTGAVFGRVVHSYGLSQAMHDGATVRIDYQVRLVPLALDRDGEPGIDAKFDEVTTGAEDDVKRQLAAEFTNLEKLAGTPGRIKKVVEDVLRHWRARSALLRGKGMIVCFSRKVCVDVYEEFKRQRPEWWDGLDEDDDARGLVKVVISGDASDGPEIHRHVRSHARLRELKQRMVDPDDPLELVIVRDMWLTGFDAPPLHTLYLDRPMRDVGLMQAIARVNRTFQDKPSGLVVDLIGIYPELEAALRSYSPQDAVGVDVDTRSANREALLEDLHRSLDAMLSGCPWRDQLSSGEVGARSTAMANAVDFLLRGESPRDDAPQLRHRFRTTARDADRAFSTVPVSVTAVRLRDDLAFFDDVAAELAKLELRRTSISAPATTVLLRIVDDAVKASDATDIYAVAGFGPVDISAINEHFLTQVQESPVPNLVLEEGIGAVSREIRQIARIRPTRAVSFAEKLKEALDRYESRIITAAAMVRLLADIASAMRADEARADTLGLEDEELAVFDILDSAADTNVQTEDLANAARKIVSAAHEVGTLTDGHRAQAAARIQIRIILVSIFPPPGLDTVVEAVYEQVERGFRADS